MKIPFFFGNANIDLLDYVIRPDFYEAILNLKYTDEAIYFQLTVYSESISKTS